MKLRFLVAALLCAGCPKKAEPPAPRLAEVRVSDVTGALDAARLQGRAEAALHAALGLPVAADGGVRAGVDWKVKLALGLGNSDGGWALWAEARMNRGSDGPARGETIVSRGLTPLDGEGERAALVRARADRLVDDVLAGLVARAKIHLGGDPELVAALGASDGDLVEEAIRVASERKARAAVPALIALLKRDDAALRDRALGALVDIGDRRAVKPITDLAHFRDVDELPKVLDALAALGGDEARAYLEFVSTGHEDPEMRTLAKEALQRLLRRDGGTG